MNTKVLFISHDAQPHGAQFLLLHLVRWVVRHAGIQAQVLLKRDGPLAREFAEVAPTQALAPGDLAEAVRLARRERPDLIYSNTITNGELLEALSPLGLPVITHVHELGYWIGYRSGAVNNAQVARHTDQFVACSGAVARCLEATLKVPREKIFTVHEFIPGQRGSFDRVEARKRIRQTLGIPLEAAVIGASGTTDWRKSPDLFVQLARAMRDQPGSPPTHFVWVGGDHCGPEFGMLWHDVERLGLQEVVHFVGHQENPRDYFAAFDLFALTSREDPYPLVALEAASLGLPLLGFAQSGGITELIESDCGLIAPYLDVAEMSRQALHLLADADLRARLGARAREKVRERHEVGLAGNKIAQIIEWVKFEHLLQKSRAPKAA